jgi:DUF1365 family protein
VSTSCLFDGEVVHVRHAPVHHRLTYRIFMGLFDLDELPVLARNTCFFGYNTAGVFSFHDRDHGDGSGRPLRPQIEQALEDAGIDSPGGPIRILCMPRLLGYVFNPLSIYFCHDRNGRISATVHEVNNTYGERQFYALRAKSGPNGIVRQDSAKTFRVSPFLPMDLDYQFTISPPGDRTSVHIVVQRDGSRVLSASFAGHRKEFSSAALAGLFLRHPAMTLKVIAGIHWEALILWKKLRPSRKQQSA